MDTNLNSKTAVVLMLTLPEFRGVIRETFRELLKEKEEVKVPPPLPKRGGMELARAILPWKDGTIYNKVHKNELPHYKKGKTLIFDRDELFAYIESGKVNTVVEAQEQALDRMKEANKGRAGR